MTKYLLPLKVFVGGQILILIAFLFITAIGNSADTLATQSAAYTSSFWLWSWVSGTNVKWLVYMVIEIVTILVTFVAFVRER